MFAIRKLLDRIFPKTEIRVLLAGWGSGRTTALYRLKLGEVVTTIPTIGFNVESLDVDGVDFTMWEVGGREKIRPLIRHYYAGMKAVIYVVDSHPTTWWDMDKCKDEIEQMMSEDELRDAVLLVWANKQDLPGALSPKEVAERLGLPKLRGHKWRCDGTCATTGDGLMEGLQWIVQEVTGKKSSAPAPVAQEEPPAESPKKDAAAAALLEILEEEDDQDQDGAETLKKLQEGKLPWDQRTRLRTAWSFLKKYGRKEALRRASDAWKRLAGPLYHETFTYFWIHMVHYAMVSTPNLAGDFSSLMLLNPQLASEDLVQHYFSDPAKGKDEVMLPDKEALPSLVLGPEAESAVAEPVGPVKLKAPAGEMSDSVFLEHFLKGTLPSWGHEQHLRATWILLRQMGRRKGGTKQVLGTLKETLGSRYHDTLAYFWLQILTYQVALVGQASSFQDFLLQPGSEALLDPALVGKHYSDQALDQGAAEFVLPDRAPLPNLVRK